MTTLRKVLVIDDDPVVGKSFDRVLSTKGYAVITAANGEEALRKIAAENYDMVYTDIRMPGMSGIEVAEHIKGHRPWLPVVIVTGHGTAENEARAKAAGVETILHKPLSPEMIEASARAALADKVALPAKPAAVLLAPAPAAEVEVERKGGTLKNIALFFAAPFIGLAYVLALPAVAAGMLAWMGMKKLAVHARPVTPYLKTAGVGLAAPFLGLAFIVALPFAGLGMLAWSGAKALAGRPAK